jgi:hypothetical protein
MWKRIRKLLRFCIALNFLFFGLLKITRLHFSQTQHIILNDTMGLRALTFYYFSAAPVYIQIIGCFQLLAGVCLLFKGSRSVGSCLALAIQTNICLINLCYSFGPLVTIYNCIVFCFLAFFSFPYLKSLITSSYVGIDS